VVKVIELGGENMEPITWVFSEMILIRGWFCFIFRTPEDSMKILQETWILNGGSLMLKRWRVGFDPVTEYFQFRHIWVLLPGLPIQFWNEDAFRAIGNELGRFCLWRIQF
jgi:hypothetical protein